MKTSKRIICVVLVAITLITNFAPANAAIATNTYQGRLSGTETLTLTLYSTTSDVKVVPGTNVQHTKGIQTAVGITTTTTISSTASATLQATVGAEYAGVSASIAASAGVAQTVSVAKGVSIQYTVPSTVESGRYRIEYVFPRSRVNFKITSSTSSTILTNKTVTYMPRIDAAYHRLTRYSDATS